MGHIVARYGMEVDLSKEGHTACPRCRSQGNDRGGDNLMVYNNFSAHCFSCGYTIPSEDWLEENGYVEEYEYEEDLVGLEFNDEVHTKLKKQTGTDPRGYRGIRADVSRYFGVRYQYDEQTGEVNKTLYPCTIGGKISGYKVRTHPKDFRDPYGESGKGCDLFGQFRFETFNHTVVIVGGEHDQLAAFQMLKDAQKNSNYDPPAVVSPTIGEAGAWKQVQPQYEFFNQFKKIVIVMDNDKAGKEATKSLVEVLPRGKVFVMNMRYKDPNKYLEDGKEKEFISDFWAAKQYTPAGVHASSSLYDAALEYTNVERLSLPPFLGKMSEMFGGGWVKNELCTIFSSTSQGKSLYVDNCITHWVMNEPKEVVGVMTLEASKDKYATNILSRYLGVNLNNMTGKERKEYLKQPEIKEEVFKFLKRKTGEASFYVYDSRGADLGTTKESILEMIIKLGVTLLVVDPYSDLVAGSSLEEQEEFISWMKNLILEYPQLTIVLICHTRKSASGSHNDELTEHDIMGSSTVMKSSAQTFSIQRDKLHENPIMRNVSDVVVHKNRHGATTGLACQVFFDFKTGKLFEWEQFKKDNPWAVVGTEENS